MTAQAPGTKKTNPTAIPGRATLRLELTCCGHTRCRSCLGKAYTHGPYWYAYWTEGKRTRKRYLGKALPQEVVLRRIRSRKKRGSEHDPRVLEELELEDVA